jgi:tetratricopeptide (TPR) repeat protein
MIGRSRVASFLVAATLALAPVALAGTTVAQDNDDGLEIWDDPSFRKEFLGSYGFRSEVEPRVTQVERDDMEKILPLLSSDLAAAAAALLEIITPESSAIFDFTLANIHFQQDRLDEAARYYTDALVKFPSYLRAHKNLGLVYVRQGRSKDAIKPLSRVIQLGGGDGLTYGLLGYCYSSTEQYVPAESAYRDAVMLQADVLDWKLGLTQAVLKQHKYGEAVTLLGELIERYPDRADFWLLQSNAYIGLGKPMLAAENFEIVQRMGKSTVQSLNTLGDIYVNESLWDLATRAYRLAAELDTSQAVGQPLRRVEVLAQRGALEQSKELLAHVKELYGDRIDSEERKKLLKLEARLAVAEGTGGEAVGVLEEIVTIDPLDGEALILLGQHYARVEEIERAIFYYERAESLEDYEAEAKVRHAQLLVTQARYDEALPLLKRAQELNPREDVASYVEQVERAARAQR